MGYWTVTIHGCGSHHNFIPGAIEWDAYKGATVPCRNEHGKKSDADHLAQELVKQLMRQGHQVLGATFTHAAGCDDLNIDPVRLACADDDAGIAPLRSEVSDA